MRKIEGRPESEPNPSFDIIELFGMSGSGKTTLARQLRAHLAAAMHMEVWGGHDTVNTLDRTILWSNSSYLRKARWLLLHLPLIPVIFFRITQQLGIDTVRLTTARNSVFRMLVYWIHCRLLVSGCPKSMVVFDQRIINAIHGVRFPTGVRAQSAVALAQLLYSKRRVAYIFIDVGPEVASERLQRRSSVAGRAQRTGPTERRRVLTLSGRFFEAVYREMVKSSFSVLRVDGHMTTEEQAERIRTWLGFGPEGIGGIESQRAQHPAHALADGSGHLFCGSPAHRCRTG